MSEKENNYYEKEQEAIKQMDDETKKAFYEFKEAFKVNLKKTVSNKVTESELEESLQEIDYIELFTAAIKNEEAKQCLHVLYDNCMIYEDVHNLAYELNSEYKILWDNLDEDTKKSIIKGRKMNGLANSIRKAKWGFATMGLSALGSKLLENKHNNKIEEYVTSEGFTNLCILFNSNHNYYKTDGEENSKN